MRSEKLNCYSTSLSIDVCQIMFLMSLSCAIVDRSLFFTHDNFEKECSPDALVTGKVKKKQQGNVHIWEYGINVPFTN